MDFVRKKGVVIMIINDLLDLVNKEQRKQERVKAAHNLAGGLGALVMAVLAIKILTARKVAKKNKEIKKKLQIKEGPHEIKNDINKVAEEIHKK